MLKPSFSCPAAFGGVAGGNRPSAFVSGVPGNMRLGVYSNGDQRAVHAAQRPALSSFGSPTDSQNAMNQGMASGGGGGGKFWQSAGAVGKEVLGFFKDVIPHLGNKPIQGSQQDTAPASAQYQTPYQPGASAPIPPWVWIAGGVVVVGGVALIVATRK